MSDFTQRFSGRVENYLQYRPRYPQDILPWLATQIGFTPQFKIADIGSGTGFLSELFLQNGNTVYGVEPNLEMRQAAERLLANQADFHSINGTAEDSTLDANRIDLISAGQAFHWFDIPKTRVEFQRILRKKGHVVLVWNSWEAANTPFTRAYRQLLEQFGTDYADVCHERINNQVIAEFFNPGNFKFYQSSIRQEFDFEGIRGRLFSSSYAPQAGHPDHEPILAGLKRIFDEHQQDNKVFFDNITRIYCGNFE